MGVRLRVYGRGAAKTPDGGKAGLKLMQFQDSINGPPKVNAEANKYPQINPSTVRGKRRKG